MSVRKGNSIIAGTSATDAVPTSGSSHPVSSGGVYDSLLVSALRDTTITTPTNGDLLQFNGSKWINAQTTVSPMTGATETTDGVGGGVPAPLAGQQNNVLRGDGTWGASYHPDLFDWKWADHIINDVQWLRADTFSWQSGSVYEAAFNDLFNDIYISTSWRATGYANVYTASPTPEAGDTVYSDSACTTSVGTVTSYDSDNNQMSYNSVTWDYNSNSYVTPVSETVAGYTVDVYTGHSGKKIVSWQDETNVANIYSATGVAWYYIIDIANNRFKLPRSKHNKYATTNSVVGNGMTLGLTDGTNLGGLYEQSSTESYSLAAKTGNYGVNAGSADSGNHLTSHKTIGVTTDATKSGLIAQQTQETDQYKYLYFYVGEFTQTALENTAGLNASLFNNKVDLDGSNATFSHVIQTYTNGTSWYRLYSDGWCEQGGLATLGTGGTGTVNFLKPFIGTDYDFQCDVGRRTDSSTWIIYPTSTYTTTSQGLKSNLTGYTLYTRWYACGYVS